MSECQGCGHHGIHKGIFVPWQRRSPFHGLEVEHECLVEDCGTKTWREAATDAPELHARILEQLKVPLSDAPGAASTAATAKAMHDEARRLLE